MTEGITYDPLGTITVEFDDETYKLSRPKLKQWRYFTRQIDVITQKTRDTLAELGAEIAAATNAIEEDADPVLFGVLKKADAVLAGPDATEIDRRVRESAWQDVYKAASEDLRQDYDEATKAIQEFAEMPFYERSSELIKEMFAQLGDKQLPDDIEEWPPWLAMDVRLPGTILGHWRTAPKASGSNGQNP